MLQGPPSPSFSNFSLRRSWKKEPFLPRFSNWSRCFSRVLGVNSFFALVKIAWAIRLFLLCLSVQKGSGSSSAIRYITFSFRVIKVIIVSIGISQLVFLEAVIFSRALISFTIHVSGTGFGAADDTSPGSSKEGSEGTEGTDGIGVIFPGTGGKEPEGDGAGKVLEGPEFSSGDQLMYFSQLLPESDPDIIFRKGPNSLARKILTAKSIGKVRTPETQKNLQRTNDRARPPNANPTLESRVANQAKIPSFRQNRKDWTLLLQRGSD